MKKLALSIIVFLGLTSLVRAQQDQDTVLTMPLSAPCYSMTEAKEILSKDHGEIPFAIGESIVWNSKIKEYIAVTTIVYANPKTLSFTIAYDVIEDGVTCMITTGEDLRPASRGNSL